MQFAIALASSTESWRAVKRAEELGFHAAWFYDTQLLNPDVFMCMTQAAMATEKIRLGTGVLIPSNRIEPVAANAFATLNKIAPGRVDFGVGTGFTGRRTMGLSAISRRFWWPVQRRPRPPDASFSVCFSIVRPPTESSSSRGSRRQSTR